VTDADTILRALFKVHPRSMQVLLNRFVVETPRGPGRSAHDFAAFYGLQASAADLLLWRSAQDLDEVLNGSRPSPLRSFDEEQREAAALAQSLAAEQPTGPGLSLLALRQHAAALRAALAEAERAEARSPARARETWLRRVAIVAVLAVSAWYSRQPVLAWLSDHGIVISGAPAVRPPR
jgi:hypothetical protein